MAAEKEEKGVCLHQQSAVEGDCDVRGELISIASNRERKKRELSIRFSECFVHYL